MYRVTASVHGGIVFVADPEHLEELLDPHPVDGPMGRRHIVLIPTRSEFEGDVELVVAASAAGDDADGAIAACGLPLRGRFEVSCPSGRIQVSDDLVDYVEHAATTARCTVSVFENDPPRFPTSVLIVIEDADAWTDR